MLSWCWYLLNQYIHFVPIVIYIPFLVNNLSIIVSEMGYKIPQHCINIQYKVLDSITNFITFYLLPENKNNECCND